MTALGELEKREKEIKGLLELSDGLDERKALRSELRDIRRKIFDTPAASTATEKKTGKTTETNSTDTNMSSKSNRFQNLDDNNNSSTATAEHRTPFTPRISTSMNSKDKNISPNKVTTTSCRGIRVALNKPKEQSKVDESSNKTAVTLNAGNGVADQSTTAKGIRRTATWAHKNRGTVASKFENSSVSNTKPNFGAQVGQSPFQFGIDFLQQARSDDKPKYTGFVKYTPTVPRNLAPFINAQKTDKDETNEEINISSPARSKDNAITQNKQASSNKYVTSYSDKKDSQNSIEKPHNRASSASELGLSFAPKMGSKDLMKRFEPNPTSNKPAPSFNKYAASLQRTNDKSQAAKNIMRSVSMRVRQTYETNSTASAEPSMTFLEKYRRNTGLSNKQAVKNENTSQCNSSDFEGEKATIPSKLSPSYLNKTRTPSAPCAQHTHVVADATSPPLKSSDASAENPLAAFGGGGATDRMAFFREAAKKEKEAAEKKKEKEEQRRKQLEAMTALVNGEIAQKKDTKKEMQEDQSEHTTPPRKESTKKEISDSEKMKNASAPCMKKREKKKIVRRTMSIGNIVLDWVQEMIKDYPVEVTNFSSSWNDGMAFCALIHHFNPNEFDFSQLKPENKRENFDLAFNTGAKVKNIPILLDTEDMVVMKKPEPRSVQTYIQWIWSVYGPTSGYGPTPQEVQK